MKLTDGIPYQTTTGTRIAVVLVTLCAFTGVAVGGVAATPVTVPNSQAAMAGSSAATDGPTGQVGDCDLIDIDGNNNTVAVNISDNATTDEDGVTVRLRCGADNATTLDHDLIDIDGNNNSVTVFVRAENATIDIGAGSGADSDGLYVSLHCGVGTPDDCDGVDIDGHNNSVTLIVRNDTERTVHEFGANTSNVSWTGGDQHSETSENGRDMNSDAQNDTGNAAEANRASNNEERSNVLDTVANGIPLVGAVGLLALGSVLLMKRNND